ncbi:ANTAR domain-containing protein [Streptomyces longwoodensis]|uniref:ANTAR domain-containing response regulator n=1 Tax=Streptomyces longwoodensis TaxID=68231 RepID=UPI002ED2EB47|nr:ANTAR domain-containing protein [Streptomyces longwoodensis]
MTTVAGARQETDGVPLVVDGRVDAGHALLTARGELVRGCAPVLARELDALPPDTRRVELDLSGVAFMDTAGLQFLEVLEAYRHRTAVPVTTRDWRGQPRRVLELAGLDPADPLRPVSRPRVPRPHVGPVASPVALERAERLRGLYEEVEQLRRAMASRPVIDQARGVLMALHSCTPDQAWSILRETSQLSNTKLRTVAEAVATSATGTPPPVDVRAALRTAIARHTD